MLHVINTNGNNMQQPTAQPFTVILGIYPAQTQYLHPTLAVPTPISIVEMSDRVRRGYGAGPDY